MQLVVNAPLNAAGSYDEFDAVVTLAQAEQAAAVAKVLTLFPALAGKISDPELKEGHVALSAVVPVLGKVRVAASVVVKPP